jgi:hypothetical protein
VSDDTLRLQFEVDGVEQVWCVVQVGVEPILVGCIFRPKELGTDGGYEVEILKSLVMAKRAVDAKKYSGLLIFGT